MDDPSWEHQNPGEGITMFNQSKAAQNMGLKANGSPGPPSVSRIYSTLVPTCFGPFVGDGSETADARNRHIQGNRLGV